MVFANSLMLQKYLCFKIFSFKSYFFAVIKRNAGELAELLSLSLCNDLIQKQGS